MTKSTFGAVATSLTLIAFALPVFAMETGTTNTIGSQSTGAGAGKVNMQDISVMREKKDKEHGGAMMNASTSAAAILCVGAAVTPREAALVTGFSTYSQAVSSAYSVRASALGTAYAQSTSVQVRTSVKAAWSAFNMSVKSARGAWGTARSSAWSTYRSAVSACKAPSSIGDGNFSDSNAN